MARIAPLIGTIGNGTSANNKPGGTVFVAAGSTIGFNNSAGEERSSSVAVAFAPSSTSTATITVAGAGNFRQRAGGGFSVAAANSLQVMPPAGERTPQAVALADTAQPTLAYTYAPAANPATKANSVEASFSDAVTATGVFAQIAAPGAQAKIQTSELQGAQGRAGTGKIETSELQTGRGQPGGLVIGKAQTSQVLSGRGQTGQAPNTKVQTSELQSGQGRPGRSQVGDLTAYSRLIDLTQAIEGSASGTQVDGTRTFISASVSANPSTTAALYMAHVVNSAPAVSAGQTVETFQIGPAPGPRAQGGSGTTVSEPLHGKIMASAGALNNSLALP